MCVKVEEVCPKLQKVGQKPEKMCQKLRKCDKNWGCTTCCCTVISAFDFCESLNETNKIIKNFDICRKCQKYTGIFENLTGSIKNFENSSGFLTDYRKYGEK